MQDLTRLLGSTMGILPQLQEKLVMGATAALIRYFDLLADDSHHGRYKMRSFSLADFMRLDTAVVGALNLLPNPAEAQQHRASSVYGLLNHCKTAMGSRLLSAWIKQPLLDLAQISKRHDIVESFVEDNELREGLRDVCLRRVGDVRQQVKKLVQGRPSIKDM